MKMKYYIYLLPLLYLCTACHKEEKQGTQEETTGLQLDFNWDELTKSDSIPVGMSVLLYSQATGELIRKEVSSDKMTVDLPSGNYQLITVNNDVQRVEWFGLEKYATAGVQLPSIRSRAKAESLPLNRSLYAANIATLTLSPGVGLRQTVALHPIACKMRFDLITDLETTFATCSGILTGITSNLALSTFAPADTQPTNVLFSFDTTANGARGEVLAFGVSSTPEGEVNVPNLLLLDVTFTDSSQTTLSVNVTEALKSMINNQIIVSIKVQQSNGMDLTGEVIGWETGEDVDVPIKQ